MSSTSSPQLDIFNPDLSVVELNYLIKNGTNVNTPDNYGKIPLRCHYESLEKVKLLVQAGADVNASVNHGRNILFYPLSTKVLKYLLKQGADFRLSDNQDITPLMYHYKSLEKVKLLVEAGADISNDILFYRNLPTPVLKYLIKAGINVDDIYFRNPLMTHRYNLNKVKLLVEIGADKNILHEDLPDPVFEYLVKAGADVNHKNYYNSYNSLLFKYRHNLKRVKLLVEAGADISGLILFEDLPFSVFKFLIAAGADVNAKDYNNSPLFIHRHNLKRVKLLVEAGAHY